MNAILVIGFLMLFTILVVAVLIFVLLYKIRNEECLSNSVIGELRYKDVKEKDNTNFFPIFERLCDELGYEYNNLHTNAGYQLFFWPKGEKPDEGFISCFGGVSEHFKWGVEQLLRVKNNQYNVKA